MFFGHYRYVASPAWLPLISLESVDGPLYHEMIADFHTLLKALPSVAELHADAILLAREVAERAVREQRAVDAQAVAQLSARVFLRHLFGSGKEQLAGDQEAFERVARLVVDASWEWRKEIAVKGRADPETKQAAVEAVLELLEATPKLWKLFGQR